PRHPHVRTGGPHGSRQPPRLQHLLPKQRLRLRRRHLFDRHRSFPGAGVAGRHPERESDSEQHHPPGAQLSGGGLRPPHSPARRGGQRLVHTGAIRRRPFGSGRQPGGRPALHRRGEPRVHPPRGQPGPPSWLVSPRAIVHHHRRLAGGVSYLVALQLVCGAVPGRAQSASVSLRSSHPSPVSGSVVLTADVPPDPELLAVQFKLDGYVLDAPDTTRPYEVVWSAASASNGEHRVTAEARYRSGTVIESTPLRLSVVNPPTFNRTLHVDAEHGDDGNDGTSPAAAWRT